MDKKLRSLEKRLSKQPTNRRGYRRATPELRREVAELASQWRSTGGTQAELAVRLGLSVHTIWSWRQQAKAAKPMRAKRGGKIRTVEVAVEAPVSNSVSKLRVTTPSGLCIEGLSLRETMALAKELG